MTRSHKDLSPSPIDHDNIHGDPSVPYRNLFVAIEMVPSQFGPFSTVKSGTGRGAVVLVQDLDGKVLLVKQNRYAIGVATWELPRGGSNDGETLEGTAEREVREETGVEVSRAVLFDLGVIHPDTGLLATEVGLFVAYTEVKNDHGANDVVAEISDRMWVDADELVEACVRGDVTDAFTVVAVLRANALGLL